MQQIHLSSVVPTFLEKEKIDRSKIWNEDIIFTAGKKIQIVAPSGSGKSSLIHFLYGLRKDYTGSIFYDNHSIHKFNIETFATYRQQYISIVFQDLRLFPEHTALQNLTVKSVLHPFHTTDRIMEMAKRLGIENKLNELAKTCSYGEQQRIAIIRSLQQPFNFLLLDEPFSNLDENNRKIAMKLIEEEAAVRNASILLADLKPIEYFNPDSILYL